MIAVHDCILRDRRVSDEVFKGYEQTSDNTTKPTPAAAAIPSVFGNKSPAPCVC